MVTKLHLIEFVGHKNSGREETNQWGRPMDMKAQLSDCQKYRYALWRRWGEGSQVVFVMLNPATADAAKDDPTIRRCIGFARAWEFGSLAVGNLFAFRTASIRPGVTN